MHPNFPDWYRVVQISPEEKTLKMRWKGVSSLSEDYDGHFMAELVRIVFKRKADEITISEIRDIFRKIDVNFSMTNNNHEIEVLSGCALAYLMDERLKGYGLIAMAVLATATSDIRKPVVGFDLVGIAKNAVAQAAVKSRERPPVNEINFPGVPKTQFTASIKKIESDPTVPIVQATLTELFSALSKYLTSTQLLIRPFLKHISIQDEELDVLWWLVNEWSHISNTSFNKIPLAVKPLIFGKEIADKIGSNVEPPALQGVLSKAGITSKKRLTIPEGVNACSEEILSILLADSEVCPTITPVHEAIRRALETGCGEAWVAGWSAVCEIAPDQKFLPLELAIQVHREQLLRNGLLGAKSDE